MDADGLLRGRRGTFSTSGSLCVAGVALAVSSIDVSGSLAAFCVAGVPLSAPQARFVWQVCHLQCQRKLWDEQGLI